MGAMDARMGGDVMGGGGGQDKDKDKDKDTCLSQSLKFSE